MFSRQATLAVLFLLTTFVTKSTAQTPSFFLTPNYPGGSGLAIADFNRDGNLDIALSAYNTTGFGAVLFGNGDGTFRFGTNLGVNGGVATADFNGDGIPDILFVTNNSSDTVGSLVVLLGNGDGTFQSPIITDAGAVLAQAGFAVGDVNGDGKPDVVAVDQAGTGLFVYLGNGDGTFKPLSPDLAIQGSGVFLGDFTGNKRLDVVVNANPNENPGFEVALGNGDGTFQSPISTSGGTALAVGDFNNDGNLDILAQDGILLGNGNGTFQPPIQNSLFAGLSPTAGAVADLNGDGKLDVVVMGGGFIGVFLGNGDGTATAVLPDYLLPVLDYSSVIAVADFNNDRKPDIVADANGVLSVLVGNGDGTFQAQPSVQTGDASGYGAIVTGDFNGDGKPDLAVVGSNVSILLNQGTGLTFLTHSYALPTGDIGSSIATADVNGDGKLDLLVGGE